MNDSLLVTLINAYDAKIPLHSCLDAAAIESLLTHPDPEIRSWLAKALVFDTGHPAAAEWLCRLARDCDPAVRVEAVDSLSEFPCPPSREALREALDDPDPLVRAYAAFGMAWTKVEDGADLLFAALEQETDDLVRVRIFEGLYLLGRREALDALIDLFGDEDYHVQCSVLHALEEIQSSENETKIHSFLASLRPADYPRAVANTLKEMQKT